MPDGTPSGLERALFGPATRGEIDTWVAAVAGEALGQVVAEVLFRSGRIDAVYGLRCADGAQVVAKVHRPPVDLASLRAVRRIVGYLGEAGYPCPRPLAGPVTREGRVVTVDVLLSGGAVPDARTPAGRRALTSALAEQVAILAEWPRTPEVAGDLGPGPAWTRYHGGPWPVPHDPIFDFSRTPEGWEWLDEFARSATGDVARLGRGVPRVVAHADWYEGNLRVERDHVVAVFDWDLVVEPEAVAVGLSAGGHLLTDAPDPGEVAAFLDDYAGLRPLDRPLAAAAARWVLAFNARCDLAMLAADPAPASALGRLLDARADYGRPLG